MCIYSEPFRALAQCSPTTPDATPLLGGAQGINFNTKGLRTVSLNCSKRDIPPGFPM